MSFRPSLKAFLVTSGALLLALPALGLYTRPELERVPIERLISNLERVVAERPDDAALLHHLARTHAMAFSSRLDSSDQVEAIEGPETPLPWFGFEPPHVPFRRPKLEAPDAGDREHLARAIELYRQLLDLRPDDQVVALGLAWMLEQAGERESAIAGYRSVVAGAWKGERDPRGIPRRWVTVETAGYLIPLLDPEKDAVEIADLESKVRELRSRPRDITPIAIPLEPDVGPENLALPDAAVRFDLDGSGRSLPWQWISPRAGWLVYDPDGLGEIDSALQMFGSRSFFLFLEHGYEALALLDDDRDGELAGAELEGLAIWRDADSDGQSDPGEVRPLSAWRIRSLSCRFERHPSGLLFSPAGVLLDDGTLVPSYDLVLRTSGTEESET